MPNSANAARAAAARNSAAFSSNSPYVLGIPRTLPRVLFGIMLAFVAIHLGLQFDRFHGEHVPWQIDQFFDLDEEQSAPNWFSSAVLAIGAVLMAANAAAARRRGSTDAGRWTGMTLAMLYMSFDEVAGLHETFNSI